MNDHLFPAALPLFRNDETKERALNQLHMVNTQSPIVWREDEVLNVVSPESTIPAGAECLIRWDTRSPAVIFKDGFEPRVKPDAVGGLNIDCSDVRKSVLNDTLHSIFVSTTQYVINNGEISLWNLDNLAGFYYEYEIYTTGGIEVNLTMGNHQYIGENEIAFPGGIRREFIRSASQYNEDPSDPRDPQSPPPKPKFIYLNPHFDLTSIPDHLSPSLNQIPPPFRAANTDGVPVVPVDFPMDFELGSGVPVVTVGFPMDYGLRSGDSLAVAASLPKGWTMAYPDKDTTGKNKGDEYRGFT